MIEHGRMALNDQVTITYIGNSNVNVSNSIFGFPKRWRLEQNTISNVLSIVDIENIISYRPTIKR